MVRGLRGPGCIVFAAATWERGFQILVCHCPSLHDCPDARTFTTMGRKGAKTLASSTPRWGLQGREHVALRQLCATLLSQSLHGPDDTPKTTVLFNSDSNAMSTSYGKTLTAKKNQPQNTNCKLFFFLLMPNAPHKRNSLMSRPLSWVQTSGPWPTSEMSRPEKNSIFFCYFKINASLQNSPIIQVRILSFHTDSTINHQTRTYIRGGITSLKGLALRFGWDTGSFAQLHLNTWTT